MGDFSLTTTSLPDSRVLLELSSSMGAGPWGAPKSACRAMSLRFLGGISPLHCKPVCNWGRSRCFGLEGLVQVLVVFLLSLVLCLGIWEYLGLATVAQISVPP